MMDENYIELAEEKSKRNLSQKDIESLLKKL